NYLSLQAFSYQGLIDQLSSDYGDQFSVEDATFAADNCGADWNAEALKAAQSYLDFQGFSYQGLIDQLSSDYGDKFTVDQATYAADNCGADWNEQAVKAAQ
ncbi:Ltp family lipoprotein, partial [Bilifractor sp. LCP21S3_A8]